MVRDFMVVRGVGVSFHRRGAEVAEGTQRKISEFNSVVMSKNK
jgi:hypothetical protein